MTRRKHGVSIKILLIGPPMDSKTLKKGQTLPALEVYVSDTYVMDI
jgi:hypothetical protein